MTTRTVPLGELARFQSGGTPSRKVPGYYEGDQAWITGADISLTGDINPRSYITNDAIRSSATSPVPAGTILLVTRTSVGKVAVADRPLCFSQDITAISPDPDRLDKRYLVQLIRAKGAYFKSRARGATIQGVTRDVVESLDVLLPPIDEQCRIADILDSAQHLRDLRLKSVNALGALGMAAFVRHFGESASEPASQVPLREILVSIENGRSPVCEPRPRIGDEYGVLKLGAVTYGEYRPSENKAFLGNVLATDRLVDPGDVLMTRKNTPELVGAVALVHETPERLLLPDLVFRLNFDPKVVTGTYLQRALMAPRTRSAVRRLASGSAASMSNISKARLLNLQISVPPLAKQREFEETVSKVEAQLSAARHSAAGIEELVNALRARAFSGRL
ncbi:restriction endonuclease subunit S [Knoellia sp. CPCC 206453]|uniref:restriction endonuclease subunit S n=1 Tax=Knoellia pratensis TaxID=3404796 RepID=UPI00360ABB7E